MTNLVLHREQSQAIALPEPRVSDGGGIGIRVATLDDLMFIDALQKKHSKMVGFLFLETLEKHIKAGNALIAEQIGTGHQASGNSGHTSNAYCPMPNASPVGYCIFQDRYDKHDDVGIFFQVNVVPGKQRGLIGAALVKAALDRAAYGCKLACCWCAQDLEANYFWESLGFVPLAFRTGSRTSGGAGSKKTNGGARIQIFWQRRIREGDDSTPYWFPSETSGGAVKENRLALPIPPGTHWSDAKPAVLPEMENVNQAPALPGDDAPKQRKPRGGPSKPKTPQGNPNSIARGRLRFVPGTTPPPVPVEKEPKPKREKFKNDPKLVAAARELRDRYIEQINAGLLLPPSANGKYDVSRQLEAAPTQVQPIALLEAA